MISSLKSTSNRLLSSSIKEYHFRFAELIRNYNHWNARGHSLERAEVDYIDGQIAKALDHRSKAADLLKTADSWLNRRRMSGPLFFTDRLSTGFTLERAFESLETISGEGFSTLDGLLFEAREENPYIDQWLRRFGFDIDFETRSLEVADAILFVTNLKRMFASKGTLHCVKLFFSVFFDEKVDIYVPKYDICYIEDNFVLDSTRFLRDDAINQEYSYVVLVQNDPSYYKKVIDQVFKPNFHPAGFMFELRKKVV